MQKKKLAIFIYSLGHGGGQKIASVLIKDLREEFDIYLVLLKNKIVYDIPSDTKIICLNKDSDAGRWMSKIKNIFDYYFFCKKNKIDISLSILTQPNYISVFTKLLGNKSKIILSEHTYQSLWRGNEFIYSKFKKMLLYLLYNRADKIITVSKKIREDLATNFKINNSKLVTVYNPYQISKIQQMSLEEVVDVDFSSKFTFVTVGTLYHVKNQELLIRAFSRIERDNIQLLVIGDGELRNHLETLVTHLGISHKVKFIGFSDNPYKYVKKSDVFVLSSNNEGLPNVIIEALACECPVVSTDCISGPREILAPSTSINYQLNDTIELGEFGILVPVKNEKLLAKACDRLVEDTALFKDYKGKTLQRALFFDANISIKNYIQNIHGV